MRGKRSKIFRRIAYGGSVRKYSHNREYQMVKCPGQHRHKIPMTIIADEERYLYQSLKGRRMALESDLG